jgi:two-component sensor histidine kinase
LTGIGQPLDLTACDREPIHIPGSIQPHGCLLVLEREVAIIVQTAGDTGRLIGMEIWQEIAGMMRDGGRRLVLRWIEQGGPETRPPSGRGFGTGLIEFAMTHELHGQAELTYAPEGLQAEITFPIG